jgi:hypothetical protein
MSKIKSIIERQRESGSGAPFKYYVNERAGDTSQIMSKNIEEAVEGGINAAEQQGVGKSPTPGKCPPNHVKDPVSNKCVPKTQEEQQEEEEEESNGDGGTLHVPTKNLSGN